ADAYLHFANLLSRVEKAPSLAVMQSLSNQAPDQATAGLALSRLAMRHQEPERALEAVQQALRLRPNWDEAALLNLRILMTLKRDAEARRFATEFLDRSPRDKRVRLAFGRYLLDQQDKSGARAQFKAVVRYYPTEGNAAFAAGLLAVEANDLKEADYYLKKALEIAPDNDQARLYLGQVASQREHYEEALQWYREVDDPDHAFDAALRIGLVYAESGAVDRARAHLAGLKPVDDRERVRLALAQERVLREVRAWDEAMQVLNAALDTVPDNTDLLYARALLAAQIRDLQLHEKDIRRVLAKEPRNAHALNALGYTLADQGQRLDEALSLVQAALELRPEDPFVLDSMGWVQFRLGNKTLAEQYLRRAFGKRPDADIAAHLGEVLWSTGAQDEARKIWQRALTDAPKSDVLNETIRRLDK
ncbi:MAG: tetratricopeptide repeat protein, partial [Gammaproteobacteria bacterium]|nr:tetratricopeptide repeat protein [Gammaproteobacteria bacterium]